MAPSRFILMAAALPAVAAAQVTIGNGVVRSNGTVIDANGIHTPATRIDASGIHRAGGGTVIRSNGNRRHVDCGGGTLSVDGNGNLLTVEHCRQVALNGNANIASVRFDRAGGIAVMGNHNRLSWQAPPGVRVGVSNLGTGNMVSGR